MGNPTLNSPYFFNADSICYLGIAIRLEICPLQALLKYMTIVTLTNQEKSDNALQNLFILLLVIYARFKLKFDLKFYYLFYALQNIIYFTSSKIWFIKELPTL